MTDYTISCDAFVRLANMAAKPGDDIDPAFKTIRIDNGQAVASNRRCMSIENIGGASGIIHIVIDPALLAQCETERAFGSKLLIVVNEPLKFVTAKTSLGYSAVGNIGHFPDGYSDFDRWRQIVKQVETPAQQPSGGMFWDVHLMAALAASSPSGQIVFEPVIDCRRPALIRDIHSYDWLGVFNPYSLEWGYHPAKITDWMRS